MVRFYANENFPLPVVERLRELGHDVVTIQETGKGSQRVSDEAVLQLASRDQRSVPTLNRQHFVRLHRAVPDHAGIVVCTVDMDFLGQAQRIHELSPRQVICPANWCE
jgi:hypothetical protein